MSLGGDGLKYYERDGMLGCRQDRRSQTFNRPLNFQLIRHRFNPLTI